MDGWHNLTCSGSMNNTKKVTITSFSGSDLISMNLVPLIGRLGVHFLIWCGVEIIGLPLLFPVFDSFSRWTNKKNVC